MGVVLRYYRECAQIELFDVAWIAHMLPSMQIGPLSATKSCVGFSL